MSEKPHMETQEGKSGEEYIRQLNEKSEGQEEEEKVGEQKQQNKENRNGSGKF